MSRYVSGEEITRAYNRAENLILFKENVLIELESVDIRSTTIEINFGIVAFSSDRINPSVFEIISQHSGSMGICCLSEDKASAMLQVPQRAHLDIPILNLSECMEPESYAEFIGRHNKRRDR